MPGSNFGTMAPSSKKAIREIIMDNPAKTSRELSSIIQEKTNRCLSVKQVAGVRLCMGQHSKKWLKKTGKENE